MMSFTQMKGEQMRLLFNTTCTDRYTGTTYEYGKAYDFDTTRANQILESGYAVAIEGVKKIEKIDEPVVEEKRRDDLEMLNLEDMTVTELRKLAKDMGVSVKGSKKEIIEKLSENMPTL